MFEGLTDRRTVLGGATLVALSATIAWSGPAAGKERYQVQYSPQEWRRRLGPARYRILREAGTERAFTSALLNEKRRGVYACAGCGLPLFSSAAKFDSGTGWPSFKRALPNAVGYRRDATLGLVRIEEHCRRCGGHLGHMFDDGPPPTGKRHCINGLALVFNPGRST